jgi:type I restriction enzyme R subunit
VPFPEQVQSRYNAWLSGKTFTPEQRWWLDKMVEHISVNLAIHAEDLDNAPFNQKGGRLGAARQFGQELPILIDHINELLKL